MGVLEAASSATLFTGIPRTELEKILHCTGAVICKFDKNEIIMRSGEPIPKVGILQAGSILVVHDDAFGNRSLLSRVAPGDLFGLSISISGAKNEDIYLCAETACQTILMDARRLIDGCEHNCEVHGQLLKNTLALLAQKHLELIRKQRHMAQHSLRGKLTSYLTDYAAQCGSREISIPFRRQAFSDYLGVDRSALCAELSRMKRDGLIDYHLEQFTLYDALFEAPPVRKA